MYKTFLTVSLLLLSSLVFAQKKEAKKILNSISDKYDSYESVEIDFHLTINYPERSSENQKASIVQLGRKFVFKSKDQDIYGDGANVWLYLKNREEVQINNYDEDDELGLITPRDLLEQYKLDKFEYDIVNKTKNHVFIEFKPTDRENEYSKHRIKIDTDKTEIISVEAFGKDGSRILVGIEELKFNLTYPDSFFSFDTNAYPELIVEDLRID